MKRNMQVMAKRTYKPKLYLDMPFSEALERFAGVDPRELEGNIKRSKQKKPPRAKKKRPGGSPDQTNVVRLSNRRKPHHG